MSEEIMGLQKSKSKALIEDLAVQHYPRGYLI